MNIETYGRGERLSEARRLVSSLGIEHIVLLPVPSSKDKKCVSGTDVSLEDTLINVSEGSVVVGYSLPPQYKERARKLGARVLDLSESESFMVENSSITAQGTLAYLLSSERAVPKDKSFGIIGYGRIGRELLRILAFFGARVRVYTSKKSVCIELCEAGIDSEYTEYGGAAIDFSGIDVLINTAPTDMSPSFPLGRVRDGMRVLELASGENFRGVEGVEYLPALPEKMYPLSAGRSYYQAVKDFLGDGL